MGPWWRGKHEKPNETYIIGEQDFLWKVMSDKIIEERRGKCLL